MLLAQHKNPIAATQRMASEWGRRLFAMTQEQMDKSDVDLYKTLLANGVPHPVAM